MAKLKAAGYPAITRAEMPPSQEVKDDLAYIANQNTSVAYVMAPDDVKVELVEVDEAPPGHGPARRDHGMEPPHHRDRDRREARPPKHRAGAGPGSPV